MSIIVSVPKAENIEIVEFREPKPYIFVEHVGPYFQISAAFQEFSSLPGMDARELFSIWLDDPDVTPAHELRSRACMMLEANDEVPSGFRRDELPAGRFAKLRLTGSYELVPEAWKFLFGLWLPHSGELARPNIPGFEIYLNRPDEGDESQLVTDLYIALR